MARVLILGGGVAGHTAASFLSRWIGKGHEVVVVTPNSLWNWIPSNIFVGVGEMTKQEVTFPLAPIYKKAGVDYRQAKALSIHPEGKKTNTTPFVTIQYTGQDKAGQREEVAYDYLINATGPRLNFDATPGLGNGRGGIGSHTVSVCTADHAAHAARELEKVVTQMKQGAHKKFLIGMGHGTCTCQGAAFEYIFNVDHYLREQGVRDKATITYITNEYELGDFGIGGMHIKSGGYITSGKVFAESLYAERGIRWIKRVHINSVEAGRVGYERLDGTMGEESYDFAMLIPPFAGSGMRAFDKDSQEITDTLFAANGMMKVDADYTPKPFEQWHPDDWPKTLQNPTYANIFAVGIAFAPPHLISKPMASPRGTPINPTPPRTGMPSAMMGKAVAASIRDMILHGATEPTHTASMTQMGAACVASTGKGMFNGSAVAMTMYPIVPDFDRYEFGRDLHGTFGTIGLAGHWIKILLHHGFLWKAQLKPGWTLIPE